MLYVWLGKTRKKQVQVSMRPLPGGVYLVFPAKMCDNTCKCCQLGRLTHASVSRGSTGVQSYRHLSPRWLILAAQTLVPLPSRRKTSIYQKSHCQGKLKWLNWSAWPNTLGMEKQSHYQAEYSTRSEATSQELAKGQSYRQAFLWNVQGLSNSGPLSEPFAAKVTWKEKLTSQSAISI